jgi:hypothetical protein
MVGFFPIFWFFNGWVEFLFLFLGFREYGGWYGFRLGLGLGYKF